MYSNVITTNNVTKDTKWSTTKKLLKSSLVQTTSEYWSTIIQPLLSQGNFAQLLLVENENLTWRSIMFNMPLNVLKFAVNAGIDSLPTYSNLHKWGKRLSDKCKHCPNTTGTLHHILCFCPTLLTRYTWRHNSVLRMLTNAAKNNTNNDIQIYADIEGHTVNGGTIPANIQVSSQRPDMVIVDSINRTIIIFELTVCFETNIESAQSRKLDRYAALVADINANNWTVTLKTLEIGCRGFINKNNKSKLNNMLKASNSRTKLSHLVSDLSRCAILCSFSIFTSRQEATWNDFSLLDL